MKVDFDNLRHQLLSAIQEFQDLAQGREYEDDLLAVSKARFTLALGRAKELATSLALCEDDKAGITPITIPEGYNNFDLWHG